MTAWRLHALIGTVLLALGGCAGQPRQPGPDTPTAAATRAPGAAGAIDARLADIPGLTPHLLALARDDGYRTRVVNGVVQFCRVQIPVGTNLRHLHCVDATGLRWEVEQEQEQRRDLRQGTPTMCQGMGC
jgi:hypothetical protein